MHGFETGGIVLIFSAWFANIVAMYFFIFGTAILPTSKDLSWRGMPSLQKKNTSTTVLSTPDGPTSTVSEEAPQVLLVAVPKDQEG